MIPGSKGLNPYELAHRWVKDLGPPTSYYAVMSVLEGIQSLTDVYLNYTSVPTHLHIYLTPSLLTQP